MAWGSYNRSTASIRLAAQVTACALAAFAIVFVAYSAEQEKARSTQQTELGEHGLLYNAEKIAKSLEEKNRKRADDVVVPYTREDKILAGFQKEVQERDAKFRHEVATVAKESKDEEIATQDFDNNGDPDDPHYKTSATSLLPASELQRSQSPFELENEEKSQKVQNHIDHEVEEITGGDEATSHGGHSQRLHVTEIKPQPARTEQTKVSDVSKKINLVNSELDRFMKSDAFKKARAAALERSEKRYQAGKGVAISHSVPKVQMAHSESAISVSKAESGKKINGAAGGGHQETAQREPVAVSSQHTVAAKATRHVINTRGHPLISTVQKQSELAPNLGDYMKIAPSALRDYMQSEAYRHVRDNAEEKSERYLMKQERKTEEAALADNKAAHIQTPKTKSTVENHEKHANILAHTEVRSYMASSAFKKLEQDAGKMATRPVRSTVSTATETAKPEIHSNSGSPEPKQIADERALLRKYISGKFFKDQENEQGKKFQKIVELRRYMDGKEFKQKEAMARHRDTLMKI